MSITFVGTTFPESYQWHCDEKELINNIKHQIANAFPSQKNLLINTTWFGPQFNNGEYERYLSIVDKHKFDNLFLLAAADPVFLNEMQIEQLMVDTGASFLFKLGHFDGQHYFNFHSMVLPKYFKKYEITELVLKDIKYRFINYNRKPRSHRNSLVEAIIKNNLLCDGLVTLGRQNNLYSAENTALPYMSLHEAPNDSNWGMDINEFGIAHDIHTLGSLEIWQQHFLNIVGETEFYPWDNMFISEKTWKPIIGLRPFLINGQTKIYKWLRNNGFKTFTHYFPEIDLESDKEYEVHDKIIRAIQYLNTQSIESLHILYNDMLPDLLYNKERFYEFSKEQCNKIDVIFKS